jgi:transcriptional regulator with XRE-family HTH domain
LAEASGVPIGTIRDYEQSRREPLLATAAKLARALGVTIEELIEEDTIPIDPPAKKGKGRGKK